MKALFTLMVCSALLLGCSSTKVVTDYNPRANFASYQKYLWNDELATAETTAEQDTPFLKDHFRNALERRLKAGLYQHVTKLSDADFIVRYYILAAPDSISRSPRLGIGLGSFSGNFGISSSVGIPLGKDNLHRNVQLMIDLLNASDKKLSWRGSLVVELDDEDPKANQVLIDSAVAEIWAQFPPR